MEQVITETVTRETGTSVRPVTNLSSRFGEWFRYIRGRGALEIGIIFVVVQIGSIIYYLIDRDGFPYLSAANLKVWGQSVPVLALLAMGAGVLMVAGEFDLSMGSLYVFSELIFLTWVKGGNNPIIAIAVAMLAVVAMAVLNGYLTTRFLVPSFIVTLGAMLFWEGGATYYTDNSPQIIQKGGTLTTVFNGQFLGIQAQVYWFVGIGTVLWLLLHRHKLGNHLLAVGGNEAAAKAISVNPKKIKLIAFGIMGALVAFAGIMSAVRVGSAQAGQGREVPLRAIAAAVVGGTALRGGKGSVLGMAIGAALIFWIQDMILLSDLDAFYLDAFIGLIIVFAAITNRLFEGKAV